MNPNSPSLPQAGAPRARSPWEVQRGVLFALLLREMKTRVGGQWIGAVWTLFEPLSHVLLLMSIFAAITSGSPFASIEYPVFLATGLVPYFLFQNISTRVTDGIDANRGLFAYRQVKPLDTLMARTGVEIIMNLLVYAVTLGLLARLGMHVVPQSPLEMMLVYGLLIVLGFGYGVFCAVITFNRPRLRTFIRMLALPLYMGSGVMFPVHFVSPDIVAWLLWNPVLHLIEETRHAFMPEYPMLDGVNLVYPMLFSLALAALALLLYRADRLRLLTST